MDYNFLRKKVLGVKELIKMEFFIKNIFEGKELEGAHSYFTRFGKGDYKRRFLTSFNKGKRIKIKASFELANDFVNFVRENSSAKFSGVVLTKDKIDGKEGKKKKGLIAYEISESGLEEFENARHYLLNVSSDDVVLKIKKAIPKPGKSEGKIDDKFCVMDLDLKYWDKVREKFFWDVPDCKKVIIEHELIITDIVLPSGVDDPVKMRELAKRKGKIIRKIIADGDEMVRENDLLV